MIIGMGIDIVDVDRIRRSLDKWGGRWAEKIFTREEIEVCRRSPDPAQSYAARFAAKEAFFKALPGAPSATSLQLIEVISDPAGRPAITVSGAMKDALDLTGADRSHLSMTHTPNVAAAVVAIEKI